MRTQRTYLASMALVLCLSGEKPYKFTRIADNSGSLTFFNFGPSINESGTVAFQANEEPTPDNGLPQGVFTGNGGRLTTVADSLTGPFGFFTSPASINDEGQVALGHAAGRVVTLHLSPIRTRDLDDHRLLGNGSGRLLLLLPPFDQRGGERCFHRLPE